MRPVLKLALSIFTFPGQIGGIVGVIHGVVSSVKKPWNLPLNAISHGAVGIACGTFWPLTIYFRKKVKEWI